MVESLAMNVRREPAAYTSETTLRTALARTAALFIHVPFRHPRFTTFRPGASFRSPGKAGLKDDEAAEEGAAFERGALEKGCPAAHSKKAAPASFRRGRQPMRGRSLPSERQGCRQGEKEMSPQPAPLRLLALTLQRSFTWQRQQLRTQQALHVQISVCTDLLGFFRCCSRRTP